MSRTPADCHPDQQQTTLPDTTSCSNACNGESQSYAAAFPGAGVGVATRLITAGHRVRAPSSRTPEAQAREEFQSRAEILAEPRQFRNWRGWFADWVTSTAGQSANNQLPERTYRWWREVAGSGTVVLEPGDSAARSTDGETENARGIVQNLNDLAAATPAVTVAMRRRPTIQRAIAGEHQRECAGNFRSWPESPRSSSPSHRPPV